MSEGGIAYKRVMLKLSGEILGGGSFGCVNGMQLRVKVIHSYISGLGCHVEVAVGDTGHSVHWNQPMNFGHSEIITFDVGDFKPCHHQELNHRSEGGG